MQESLVPSRSRRSGAGARAGDLKTSRWTAAVTCSVRVIQPFARYLARSGQDCEVWLGRHGLTMAALQERDLRVPHTQAMAMLHDAMALSGDSAIGIYAAHCDEPGDFDVMEYAAVNCASGRSGRHDQGLLVQPGHRQLRPRRRWYEPFG